MIIGRAGGQPLWSKRYLFRVAGSARGGGTVVSGQGYMQKMLWACLSEYLLWVADMGVSEV